MSEEKIEVGYREILATGSDLDLQATNIDPTPLPQVSFIGYAVGGAFLGLAYVDLIYHLLAILILVLRIVESENEPKYYKAP